MCEYCEKRKELKSCNFCGNAKITIYDKGFTDNTGMLEMQGNDNTFKIFKTIYCPRFDINYCPMCGAPLNKSKDNKLSLRPDLLSTLNFIYDCYVLEDDINLDESGKELKQCYKYVIDDLILHNCLELYNGGEQ